MADADIDTAVKEAHAELERIQRDFQLRQHGGGAAGAAEGTPVSSTMTGHGHSMSGSGSGSGLMSRKEFGAGSGSGGGGVSMSASGVSGGGGGATMSSTTTTTTRTIRESSDRTASASADADGVLRSISRVIDGVPSPSPAAPPPVPSGAGVSASPAVSRSFVSHHHIAGRSPVHGPGLSAGPVFASTAGLDLSFQSTSGLDVSGVLDSSHLTAATASTHNSRAVLAALRTLQERIRKLSTENKRLKEELGQTTRRREEMEIRLDHELTEFKSSAKLEETRMRTEISRLTADKHDAETRATMHLEQTKTMEREVETLRQQVRSVETAKVSVEKRVVELESNMAHAKDQLARARMEVTEFQTHNAELRDAADQDRRARLVAEERRDSDQATISSLMQVNEQLRAEMMTRVKGRGVAGKSTASARASARSGSYMEGTPRRSWQLGLRSASSSSSAAIGGGGGAVRGRSVSRRRRKKTTTKVTRTSMSSSRRSASNLLNVSHASTGGRTVHEKLTAAYGGPVPFMPGPNTPTHSLIGNVQIAVGRSEAYGGTTRKKRGSSRSRSRERVPDLLATSQTMTDTLASRHNTTTSFSSSMAGAGGLDTSTATATTAATGGVATPGASAGATAAGSAFPMTPPRVVSPSRSSRGMGNSASPSPSRRRTEPDSDLDAVIDGLKAEYEALNSRYATLLNAAQLDPRPDVPLQKALQELTEIMARKREQLDRLQRLQRSYRVRVSRSPVRSPAASRQRAEALRSMAVLKHIAAHPEA